MRKVKTFARTFWRSLTEPAYYQDILSAKFSFSLKYLFTLLLIISSILAIGVSVRVAKLIPQVPAFLQTGKAFLIETYPQELKLTLKNKKITTNVKEPYFINLADDKKGAIAPLKHLLVIDTKGQVENFKNLESLFLLTGESLVVPGGDGESYKVVSLTETFAKIPDGFSLTKTGLETVLNQTSPYLLKVAPKVLIVISIAIVIIYAPLSAGFSFLIRLILLLPISLILFLGAKIAKRKITFNKTYQLSLQGMTIPVVLSFAFGFSGFYGYAVILSWLAFFVFMTIVLKKLDTT
jgi:hypothetical protein